MHYVYLLRSINFAERTYVGYTTNLDERLRRHNSGGSFHTSKYRPWVLVTYIAFDSKQKALDFEKYIKVLVMPLPRSGCGSALIEGSVVKNNAKATILALLSLLSNAIFCVQNQKRTDVETIVPSKVIFEALQPFHLQSDDIESIALRIAVAPDEHHSDFVVACHNLATEIVLPAALCEQDAVLVDPQHHAVIAENEYVRVLWVVQRAGKAVAAHSHQWPSVMFIITGSQFLTHGLDGSTEYETYGPGVYAFEGESDPYGFTNCGQSTFQALVIELKQMLPGR